MPFWEGTIVPSVKSGKRVLVVAHGNSIRAIVKKLSNVNEKGISFII
jgi:2,3-bisphosphoglycerate-dependent phosphoglycerate mutase